MPLRAAIAGCGRMGDVFDEHSRGDGIYSHAEAYAACPDISLVAICDPDPVKLAACGERWQVAARYRDLRTMLGEARPDVLSICTPDATHYDCLLQGLETPGLRAILAEKPLAMDRPGAVELACLAERRGVALAVNYSRRYAANIRRLKEQLDGGLIGAVQTLSGFYTKGTIHNGTHWFDLLRLLAGEVHQVCAFDRLHEPGPDPTLDVQLELSSGARAYLQGCDAGAYTVFEMDILGASGRVRLTDGGHTIELSHVQDSPRYGGYRELRPEPADRQGMGDVTLHAIEDLLSSAREGWPPGCSAWDAVAALDIAQAALTSAREGLPVRVRGNSAELVAS